MSRGFDGFYGFLAGMHDYFKDLDPHWGPLMDGRKPSKLQGYLTDALADRADEFIRKRQDAGGPWFLYLAFNAVHTPMQAREDKLKRFAHIPDKTRRTHAAMVSSLDDAVGRILVALRDAGTLENTLVFFLSDNGGPLPGHAGANGALNTPLRGSKLEVWEGGVRVPLFLQWKNRVPAGRVVEGMVSSMDIAATALAAAGADPTAGKPLDGLDLLPLAEGRPGIPRHDALVFQMGQQHAIRMGDWKWVSIPRRPAPKEGGNASRAQQIQGGGGLFNLREDIGENHDLSPEQPERLRTLRNAYESWDRSASAEAMEGNRSTNCPPTENN